VTRRIEDDLGIRSSLRAGPYSGGGGRETKKKPAQRTAGKGRFWNSSITREGHVGVAMPDEGGGRKGGEGRGKEEEERGRKGRKWRVPQTKVGFFPSCNIMLIPSLELSEGKGRKRGGKKKKRGGGRRWKVRVFRSLLVAVEGMLAP